MTTERHVTIPRRDLALVRSWILRRFNPVRFDAAAAGLQPRSGMKPNPVPDLIGLWCANCTIHPRYKSA